MTRLRLGRRPVARAVRIVTAAARPPEITPSCPFDPACTCGHGRRRDDRTYALVPVAEHERYTPERVSPHLFPSAGLEVDRA